MSDYKAINRLIEYWKTVQAGCGIFPTNSGILTNEYAQELALDLEKILSKLDSLDDPTKS